MKQLIGKRFWGLLAVLLVPLLIASAFLAGSWGADARSTKIKAAIVNNDQAVTVNGQITPLGRVLAAALSERQDQNVTWELTNDDGAAQGLSNGTYAAVVTIPKDFSAAATSFSGKAGEARQATIDVRTSPSASISDAAIAQQVASLAADTVNQTLTQSYLSNVYVGFNQMGTQFVTLAKGADQLATGASSLAKGVDEASKGTSQLNNGLRELSTAGGQIDLGANQLISGGSQVTAPAATINSGAQQLVSGGAQLSAPGTKLANGASELSTGAAGLAQGASQLSTGARQLATGVQQYTQGTAQVVNGIGQLASGLDALNQGLQTAPADTKLGPQLGQLDTGAQQVASGTQQLASGIKTYDGALGQMAASNDPLLSPVPGLDQVQAQCQQLPSADAATCAAMAQVYVQGFVAGQKTGLGAAQQALRGNGDASKSLVNASSQVAGGADQLSTGVHRLATQLPSAMAAQQQQLAGAVQKLSAGAAELSTKSKPLAQKGPELATGAQQLASGASELSTGTTKFAAGTKTFSVGVGQYTAGVDKYVAGVETFAGGIQQYTAGVDKYVTGVNTFAVGVSQYTAGVTKASGGAGELNSGMKQLAAGATRLSDGMSTFSKGLAKGQTSVPSYSQTEREKLSTAAARPVASPTDAPVGASTIAVTIAVLALGLWLGALALSWARPPVPSEALASTHSTLQLWAKPTLVGLGFSAIEAVALGTIASRAIDLSWGRSLALVGLLLLIGIAFTLVNQALAAWSPEGGRVAAIVAAAAAAAVSVTAAVPGIFSTVHALTPLAPALTGLRAVVAGETVVGSVGALVAWMLGAGLASFAAIASKRQLSVKGYLKRLPPA